LDPSKARALYESGFSSVYHISRAKPIDIMKALQRTLVAKRQFSNDLSELFKGTNEENITSLSNSE
jgi:hypothetical protein